MSPKTATCKEMNFSTTLRLNQIKQSDSTAATKPNPLAADADTCNSLAKSRHGPALTCTSEVKADLEPRAPGPARATREGFREPSKCTRSCLKEQGFCEHLGAVFCEHLGRVGLYHISIGFGCKRALREEGSADSLSKVVEGSSASSPT